MIQLVHYKKTSIYKTILFLFLFFTTISYSQEFTDSNLPIIVINTDIDPNTKLPVKIPDDPRVLATMKVIKHPDGSRNYLSDSTNTAYLNYNGRINIEIRGSTSQNLPKKPYGLTTLKADNSTDNNVKLLDMPSEHDWILNSLAYDASLIRDYLSYNLFRQMGNYATRTVYCEVVINNQYVGLYLLQEKIKADSNRVDIVKITPTDNIFPNITGGYITKSDKTTGGDPIAWEMNSYYNKTQFIHELPKPTAVTLEQNAYIYNQFHALETTTSAKNTSYSDGYPSIIDVPSFVDFMLINELSSNVDGYQLSTYYHKDRNGKLRAGPIWDFNLTFGNDLFQYGLDRSKTDIWQFDNYDNVGPKFWNDLFNESTYKCYLSKRWNQLTQPNQIFNHTNLVTYIDETLKYINEAKDREHQKWKTLAKFDSEISAIKTFLSNRIDWITNNTNSSFTDCSDVKTPSLVITGINYNPATSPSFLVSNDLEFIEIENTGNETENLTGVYFKELGLTYQFPVNSTIAPNQTIYLASNSSVFSAKYGFDAFDQYTRNLSNSTANLVLADAFGNIIDRVEYSDTLPWPVSADGKGAYLKLINTNLDNNLASSWEASIDNNLSVSKYGDSPNLKINPNPVQSILTINATQNITAIDIFDVFGKSIKSISTNTSKTQIDFNDFANGLYIIKISDLNGSKIEKIIKQ